METEALLMILLGFDLNLCPRKCCRIPQETLLLPTLTSWQPIIFIITVTVGNTRSHSKHVTFFKQILIGLKIFPYSPVLGHFLTLQMVMKLFSS